MCSQLPFEVASRWGGAGVGDVDVGEEKVGIGPGDPCTFGWACKNAAATNTASTTSSRMMPAIGQDLDRFDLALGAFIACMLRFGVHQQ